MQKVLSPDLWKTVKIQARKARQRKAAIAYVTCDLIGFRRGDVLVLDASAQAIASGQTDAHLLRKLQQDQVRIYHCGDLHAKVMLLGDVAVIGSGNLSNSSANSLVEAAVMTDDVSTVSAVASFIHQLVKNSMELLPKQIAQLCQIKVIARSKRGRANQNQRRKTTISRLGHNAWIVGLNPYDPSADEERMIKKTTNSLRARRLISQNEDPDWMRWPRKSRFALKCLAGDLIIQVQRSNPSKVFRLARVLQIEAPKDCHYTYFYLPEAEDAIPWKHFKQLLRSLGYPHLVTFVPIMRRLDPDVAGAIDRRWHLAKTLNRRTQSKG